MRGLAIFPGSKRIRPIDSVMSSLYCSPFSFTVESKKNSESVLDSMNCSLGQGLINNDGPLWARTELAKIKSPKSAQHFWPDMGGKYRRKPGFTAGEDW